MGWTDSHLHSFLIDDVLYGMHFEDWPEGDVDEKEVNLLHAVGSSGHFRYEYDFGDSWTHDVLVEELSHHRLGLKFPICLGGENACPPEDVGGVSGYERFKAAMADPTDQEHEYYFTWFGRTFDAKVFDLVLANAEMQRVR